MKITVRIHALVAGRLAAWRRSLSPNVYLAELKRRLAVSGGLPAGAETDDTTDPPTVWCELTGGTWVQYTVTDLRLLGWVRSRDIEIIDLQQRLPPPSPPSNPPA